MIGLDTNILVYAHRSDCSEHRRALNLLERLASSSTQVYIAWPCIYEFLRVVTHRKIFKTPSKWTVALSFIRELSDIPTFEFISHGSGHIDQLSTLSKRCLPKGNEFFDQQIAGIYLESGVLEIISNDSDFLKFKEVKVSPLP